MRPNELQSGPKALFFLRGTALVLLLVAWCLVPVRQVEAQWINEIHYDNDGGDTGEFVEVAGPANTDLSGWSIKLYNGNGGTSYSTKPLSGIIPDLGGGIGALAFYISGIQNGSPDGVALVDAADNVTEFLCYEGTLTAVDGPANGMTCTDIGVAESGSTPVGWSLQLIGNGTSYSDFKWAGPLPATPGALNLGQNEESGCPDDYLDRTVVAFQTTQGQSGNTSDDSYLIDFCGVDPVVGGNEWTYWVKELDGKSLSHWNIGGFICYPDAANSTNANNYVEFASGLDNSVTPPFEGLKWDVPDDDGFVEGLFSFTLPDTYSDATTEVEVLAKAGQGFATATILGPACETSICPADLPSVEDNALKTLGVNTAETAAYGYAKINIPGGYSTNPALSLGAGTSADINLVAVCGPDFDPDAFDVDNPACTGSAAVDDDNMIYVVFNDTQRGPSTIFMEFEDQCGTPFRVDPPADFFATASAGEGVDEVPANYSLEQNYPNPFNPTTTISFALPEASPIRIVVYDVMGREVKVLANQMLQAGMHTAMWDGTDASGSRVASGVYLYRIEAGSFTQTRRMTLLK